MDIATVPRSPRHQHGIAYFFLAITFFLVVQTVGPDTVQHTVDTSVQMTAPLEPSIVLPEWEHNLDVGNIPTPLHISMPETVRGIYLTSWTAGTTKGMKRTLELFDDSILNTVVIDIKDASGKLSYMPLDPALVAMGVGTKRIADLESVIEAFHSRGIYVIGRLAVFQDPFYAHLHPEDAFVDTRTGEVWTDYKGIAWLRPDSIKVGEYVAAIAHDAYMQGFDEINFDYVRFPSDGELKYIDLSQLSKNKAETMRDFFTVLDQATDGIPISADVFGLTMSVSDDLGIGQKATFIAPLVDALAPMLYPSHFWNGTYGIAVPATEPYAIIYKSLSDGIAKFAVAGIPKEKLRPWFQDFDLVGVEYTADRVRAQIEAARALGIDSWLMWDPRNLYTKEVYMINDDVGVERI